MKSKILMAAGSYILPVFLLFSIYLLFRGHVKPGGGFVGGLTAASGFALYTITHGRNATKGLLPFDSSFIIVAGLTLMLLAGVTGFFSGGNFLEATRVKWELPVLGKPATTFLFDLGVYFVVIGSVNKIILTITEE
jgi:multicomponent Na+:H+ antiporter subunit B